MKNLIEIQKLLNLVEMADSDLISVSEHARISVKDKNFPIISFEIGCKDKDAPVLGLFGGVHGLERVGTNVVTSYLKSLFIQLKWDEDLRNMLKTSRIVAMPLINPGGMALGWRANPNGVDLMRNAPVEAQADKRPFLVGGHRISSKLPWFRGHKERGFEKESQVMIEYVQKEIFPSSMALTIDFHSGFGMKDRFWYPYAKTTAEFPSIKEVKSLKNLIDENLAHHIYTIEPQSINYTTHGDLWDYLYDNHRDSNLSGKNFIPWTLEMGSWNWVKKNPKQIFSALGLFNPIIDHRYDRVMRRHNALIELMFKATRNTSWVV